VGASALALLRVVAGGTAEGMVIVEEESNRGCAALPGVTAGGMVRPEATAARRRRSSSASGESMIAGGIV